MLRVIFRGIQKNGFKFVLNGLRNELKSPTTNYTKFIAVYIEKLRALPQGIFFQKKNKVSSKSYLVAVYDLNSSAITFDFAFFLVAAEAYASRNGLCGL